MASVSRRVVATGFLVGIMMTAMIVSCLYAAWRLAGLPFVPFDFFDWLTRLLPGRLIAFGIDSMVSVIRALGLGPTAEIAKMMEQAMGIAGVIIIGAVFCALLFAVLDYLRGKHLTLASIGAALAIAVPFALISCLTGRTATVSPLASFVWVLLVFLVWGVSCGRFYARIAPVRPTPAVPVGERAGGSFSVVRINRRLFMLRLAGATVVITVSGALAGLLSGRRVQRKAVGLRRWSATHALPNAGSPVTPVTGTRPEYTPLEKHYRIDIDTFPPDIDGGGWRLKISGLVEEPLEMTLDDLRKYQSLDQFITLACISNPIGGDLTGTTRWTGVSLKRLVADFRLKQGASHLKIHGADGFYETVSLERIMSDDRVMLAYAWDGIPLLPEHGFPLRVYIPNLYGMKQPKWIESIEVIDQWEPGYWVVRGWDREARMKAVSVIDVVESGKEKNVLAGGIAHAGSRGISRVELRVDDGPWREAKLRTPLSGLTWVIWRCSLPFLPGNHIYTVRCFEGDGTPQIATSSPPDPSGATGLFSRSVSL